ncbi:hypothetical protein FOXYSP1_00625 [Fusarium oxysporum f. sp. phaseoli]
MIIFLNSLLDFMGHIMTFHQITPVGIRCLQASSNRHRDSEAMMLLAVAIRR